MTKWIKFNRPWIILLLIDLMLWMVIVAIVIFIGHWIGQGIRFLINLTTQGAPYG